MNKQLYNLGYRLHCTYSTYDGRVLKGYIKFDLLDNVYAFEFDNKVIQYGISGKDSANEFFKRRFADIVDTSTKKVYPRLHLYYVHYRVNSRGEDMVQTRTSKLEKGEFIKWWNEAYRYAIANHGYELVDVEQAF